MPESRKVVRIMIRNVSDRPFINAANASDNPDPLGLNTHGALEFGTDRKQSDALPRGNARHADDERGVDDAKEMPGRRYETTPDEMSGLHDGFEEDAEPKTVY